VREKQLRASFKAHGVLPSRGEPRWQGKAIAPMLLHILAEQCPAFLGSTVLVETRKKRRHHFVMQPEPA